MTSNITKLRPRRNAAIIPANADTLSEVFPASVTDAGGAGFVLSRIADMQAPLLWVQDRLSRREAGHPYLPALAGRPVLRVDVGRPRDVLWALEEGLRCKAICAAIGEIWGDPQGLDFTATKRLALRAEANARPCWLIRHAASADLSAARNRWRVASLPAQANLHDPRGPGDPRWRVELFRSRSMKPATWEARHDSQTGRTDFTTILTGSAELENEDAGRHAAGL